MPRTECVLWSMGPPRRCQCFPGLGALSGAGKKLLPPSGSCFQAAARWPPTCSEQGGVNGGSARMPLLGTSPLHTQRRRSLPGTARRGVCSARGRPGEPGKREALWPLGRGGGDCAGQSRAHAGGAVRMRQARSRRPALQCWGLPSALKSQPCAASRVEVQGRGCG